MRSLRMEKQKGNVGMKNKGKSVAAVLLAACMIAGLSACGSSGQSGKEQKKEDGNAKNSENVELTVLAAASMTDAMQEIGKVYQKTHENITFTYQFDSSGTLKTQIEEGAPADIFISAATKQMDELKEAGLVEKDSIFPWLENKVVLIVPKNSDSKLASFEDAAGEDIAMIAIGNEDVPVGQYTEIIYKNLGLWDQILEKANLASNVRQVLDWVATENVPCGVVYATDAKIEEKVEVVCEAPEGSCEPVVYPAGIVSDSRQKEEAFEFLEFLKTEEVSEVLEQYGFTPCER